jgi:hypothetical protein
MSKASWPEKQNRTLFVDSIRASSLNRLHQQAGQHREAASSLGYKTPAAYAGKLTAPNGVKSAEALTAAG